MQCPKCGVEIDINSKEGCHQKVLHQLSRAIKLADAMMFKGGCIPGTEEGDLDTQWNVLALTAGITSPSDDTRAYTLLLIKDRLQVEAARKQQMEEIRELQSPARKVQALQNKITKKPKLGLGQGRPLNRKIK